MNDKIAEFTADQARITLCDLVMCAASWEPQVRLLGNITAEEMVAACTSVVACLDAALARAEKAEAERKYLAYELARRCSYGRYGEPQFWLEEAEYQVAAKRGEVEE